MILLALCLSVLYGIDDPGVDTVNKLFEEARFAEEVVPPETTAESGSDSSASYYPSSTNTNSSFKTGSSQGDTDHMDLV
ncbi:hypothetical protein MVLG_00497 [Microbotryum lychnidis-dioicae p1A1 Lamole]|uniref:Uncharacterized protein n=1 Tax=Microbotryum lychnidis-dioicae (strain p1A1 Lamole / MvSl-1064) TaxID=683840 RepID=U5GZ93_USTV1|nr:hypothetical protein MVLG_00497 [Microbotryum lychnidis-dioicae p1A1 Lamole]|eukprot:KDE09175.1 hypothetical protein MVLG_00497 [Microbotryum lychnidis-dioicae p1A1 Lamole]